MSGWDSKVIIALIGLGLWLVSFNLWHSPQEALAEDIDIKNRLSYISKIVATMESAMIKIKGDLRFVKRQASLSIASRDSSEKRLNNLETKITAIESLLDSIAADVAKIGGNLGSVEKKINALVSESCDNIVLCKRKK